MQTPDAGPPITLDELDRIGLERLHGVGPRKLEGLHAQGLRSVLDLITHYPRRYVDRTREARIADLRPGVEALVLGRVNKVGTRSTRNRRTMVDVTVTDETGRLHCTFFNQPWRTRQLTVGRVAAFFGKADNFRGQLQMTNPVVDLIGDQTGRIVPVYPQSERDGLTTSELAEWISEALRRTLPRGLADPVPRDLRSRWNLTERSTAISGIHNPDSMAVVGQARNRLVFDELLRVQLALVRRKKELERTTPGVRHATSPGSGAAPGLVDRFLSGLPFPLTRAQGRVIREITADLALGHPMHRLLQGDVGAGKTLVALAAMLTSVQGGHQATLMAPTEVLAEQHHEGMVRLLDGFTVGDPMSLLAERPVSCELLTSRTAAKQRRRILADLAAGRVDLVVGTHALLQPDITFASLGVVVVDEQHRFGVEQRAALRAHNADGTVPDVLVMTATPIPRTAAMTVYGDLDVSVLDELPPGRTPIVTRWASGEPGVGVGVGGSGEAGGTAPGPEWVMADVWRHVRSEVAAGRQAYVVCPLITANTTDGPEAAPERAQAASATDTRDRLAAEDLAGLRVGLLHGRMTPADKHEVMGLFRSGELDVLVATTVIEVGVDVPNATVMVVLDADRFGIAQLHQLRGRVGRGKDASTCWLVASDPSEEGRQRLAAMVRTTDGFELAEVDLDLRGEGTLMGERQKGRNDLKLASLRRDRIWVERAREAAEELVGTGDGLDAHPVLAAEVDLFLGEADAEFLMKS